MLDTSISLSMEALMTDVQFSRKELEDLARKVAALHPFLSSKERLLLLAIFASAEHHVTVARYDHGEFASVYDPGQAVEEDEGTTLGDLMQHLLNSYIPGNTQPETGPPQGLAAKVTGTPPPGS